MFKGRRALYLQLSAFVVAIGLLLLLSRFFPIVDLIAETQKRVLNLGPWSALLFPLLFAVCNILLLPGGILSVGGGFFFGLWWGFVIVLAAPMLLPAMVSSKAFRRADAQNPGTGGTAGRMEDHFFEPTSSLFPDEPAKLSLRPNQNSIPRLHGLGFHRASTWALRVCLSRDARSIWPERGAR